MANAMSKRKEKDMMDLMMHEHKVETIGDSTQEFYVKFEGPRNSKYEGGFWRLKFELPDDYPVCPPLVKFLNIIYHPNINDVSGQICLNVLKENWNPVTGLCTIVEDYIPQLLMEPNPEDPYNREAAVMMTFDPVSYDRTVKEFVQQYAKREDAGFESEKESEEEKETETEDSDGDESEKEPDHDVPP